MKYMPVIWSIVIGGCIWFALYRWAAATPISIADPPIAGKDVDKVPHRFWAEVTAYCSCEKCCGKYADGRTANGHKIRTGDKFCAADKRWPFETIMDIPGYGNVPVLDRGGAIKGNKLDVYFDTHAEALAWGRKHLEVTISNKHAWQ
jgi:3D (Asp-Asp-Asp) domain-containing protein